jgi:hypothetical protein
MSGFTTDTMKSIIGGGIPGSQPKGGLLSDIEGGGERGLERSFMRRVMGHKVFPNGNPNVITPFRRYFNAGDTAGTVNSGPSLLLGPPINQSGNSMVSRIHANQGGTSTGDAFFTGNPKKVYDGSDYVRFKKIQAGNRNYNDSSFGGENGSTISQALRRVRS